jgi:hypothetical protein
MDQYVEYRKAYFEGEFPFLVTCNIQHIRLVVGYEYNDSVTIASGVVISQQSIGVALDSDGINPYDGVLG